MKRINAEDWCPMKFLLCDVEKRYQETSSQSQLRGQLFEYLAFGSLNREHQIPVLERTSRGKVTAEEKRIIAQASELKRILPLHGITVLATCVPLTIEWTPGVFLTLLMDAFVYWDRSGDPNPENSGRSGYYVLDAKLTASLHSTFGPYSWGAPWDMDHLQAHVYQKAAETVLRDAKGRKRQIGFVYAVFDYKAKPEHRLIEIRSTALNTHETNEKIRLAVERLQMANDEEFPPIPSFSQCKTCPVPDCPKRASVPAVQVVN